MEITWQESVTIAAPVGLVYAYLADFPRHAEWAQSVERLTIVRAGDAQGLGTIYRTNERQGWQADRRPHAPITYGVPGDTFCEVLTLEPGRRLEWRAWAPVPGVRHEGHFSFVLADVPGGTLLTQTGQLTDNWLGDLISRLVFKTTPAKVYAQWQASLYNIKLILENPAAAAKPQGNTPTGGVYVA